MARTVIGFYQSAERAMQVVEDLAANEYDLESVRLTYEPGRTTAVIDYDNTMEQAPVIEFKEATFGSDITEEDAVYYSAILDKGHALLAVFIPTGPQEEPGWEEATAKTIEDFVADGGAYDHEIRKIWGNRMGLTTYPQNRWIDPMSPNQMTKDRIYESRSPLNGEVSNVIGVPDTSDYMEELEALSGRRVLTGKEALALRKSGKL